MVSFDRMLEIGRAVCRHRLPEGLSFTVGDLNRDLGRAHPGHVCFFDATHASDLLKNTRAGFCFIEEKHIPLLPESVVALVTRHPYRSFVSVLTALMPDVCREPGIHPRACVDATAVVHGSCTVNAGAYIGADAVIGEGCWIGAGAVIGDGVTIGDGTQIHPRATIDNAVLGSGVVIHSGACIGKEGFGFVADADGFLSLPHQGRVIIGDNVHIGANTVVDRGSFQDTSIGHDTRIDSLVQIGHNVTIGSHVMIAAQCGLAGSCVIQDRCILGGQTGVANKVVLAKGTIVAAKSGVMKDSKPGDRLAGIPAFSARLWHKHTVWMRKHHTA